VLSRRWAFASATALVAALALSACSGSSSSSSTTAAADPLASVTVAATAAGKAPDVSLTKTPLTVSKTVSKVVTEGGGAPLTSSDLVSINAMIVNGADGKTVTSTWDSTPVGLDLGASDLFPSLKNTLPGMKVGSRILIASPPADAFGTSGNSSLGISATDSVVFVVDVLSTTKALAAASGTAVPPRKNLPKVAMTDGKAATITMPKGVKPPAKLVVQPLIKGTGAKVTSGQTVRVTYTGVLWRNGVVFDATAQHTDQQFFEFPAGQHQVISAWDKAIVGATVGSRLLLVVPPSEGYGSAGSPPKIKGTDTLVFVVDILAAY
jgi:peptidylprolyl isomerase